MHLIRSLPGLVGGNTEGCARWGGAEGGGGRRGRDERIRTWKKEGDGESTICSLGGARGGQLRFTELIRFSY